MMGMREHVHGLYPRDGILCIQQVQIAGLGSRVAGYVDHRWRRYIQDLVHQPFVHTSSWRVGNDHVGPAFALEEIVGADVDGVAGKKPGMPYSVKGGILAGVGDGFFDDFYPYDARRLPADENPDTARSAIEVIDRFPAREF